MHLSKAQTVLLAHGCPITVLTWRLRQDLPVGATLHIGLRVRMRIAGHSVFKKTGPCIIRRSRTFWYAHGSPIRPCSGGGLRKRCAPAPSRRQPRFYVARQKQRHPGLLTGSPYTAKCGLYAGGFLSKACSSSVQRSVPS
jgi:hypothetical protein